jgi:uncharacterized damage-inducible protein DinB
MNPDQAAVVARAMVSLWEGEIPATIRVLSAVSGGDRDYRPDPRSRSVWELAVHIATADVWFMDCIERGVFHMDPEAVKAAEAGFAQVSDVVSFYETAAPAGLARLRALPAEQLADTIDFFGMMKMQRASWIGFANNHSVHHRGQLSAHLRAMGSKVPDIYGPSGDAEPVPTPA